MNRQRLVLFILLILFGVTLIWSYNALPRPKTVDTPAVKPGQRARQAAISSNKRAREADDGSRLKIGLLDKEPITFKGYRRDIFKPVFADEMKAVKKPAVAIPPLPAVLAPVQARPASMQPEAAPLARFTFLGFLQKGSVKTIFLAKEKDILLVKKGDKFAGRYEATGISDQTLTLTVTDTGDEIVIPLIENRPLVPAR